MKTWRERVLNNRGVALITVILIVGVLVAFAIELNRSARADIYNTASVSDGIKLAYIAKSGVYGAVALLTGSETEYDTLFDDWANMEVLSAKSKDLFENGYFIVKVEDEMGKIPLNKLVKVEGNEYVYNNTIKDILLRLLSQPEFALGEEKAEEIVGAIKDWIDADDEVTGGSAESLYSSTLDSPYKAKNAPLDCIEELLMIKGVTKEIFSGTKEKPALSQYVTVNSIGTININTAPLMVLRALSVKITPEVAQKMDEFRRSKNPSLANNDWWYRDPNFAGLLNQQDIAAELTVKSHYFKIISTGEMNEMKQTITTVIKRDGSSGNILKWRIN